MAGLLSPRAQRALLDFLWPSNQYRRKMRVIIGILGLLGLVESRRRVVTRLLRALKRGITAAIASYIEERGGMKLFTLDDEIPAPLPESLLHPGQQPTRSPESLLSPTQPEPTSPDATDGAAFLNEVGGGSASSSAAAAASLIDRLLTSAKLFSCMDLDESRRLYARCPVVLLQPSQHLFSAGDPSDAGVFIVAGGRLGLYWEHQNHQHHSRTSNDAAAGAADPTLGGGGGGGLGTIAHVHLIATLGFGQSVGDVDMLDGMPRTLSCRAMGEGCRLIQVSRELFLKTAAESPRVLQLFLQMSIARLWRVASFTLRDFLQLPLEHAPAIARPLTEAQAITLAEAALQQPGQRENILSAAAATYFNGTASLSPPASPKGVVAPLKALSAILSETSESSPPPSATTNKLAAAAAVRPSSPLAMLMQPLRGILRSSNWRSAAPDEPGTPRSLKSQRRVSFSDVNQLHRVLSGAALAAAPVQAPGEVGRNGGAAAPVFPLKVQTSQASITDGWDVVSPDDSGIAAATLELLKGGLAADVLGGRDTFGSCPTMSLDPGEVLNEADESLRGFFILLEGCLLVERAVAGKRRTEMAMVVPGSVVHGGAFLTGTKAHCRAWAAGKERCLLAAVGQADLDALVARAEETAASGEEVEYDSDASMHSAFDEEDGSSRPGSSLSLASMVSARSALSESPPEPTPGAVVAELLLTAARALGPTIRQFISLGLSREWMRAGDVVYREGDPAEALYIVISGRARLLHSGGEGSRRIVVDDEVGRGASMGAVWTLSGGIHDTTCLCVRDVEAVRMSKASFEMIAASRPKAAARVLQGMAMRLAAAGASRRAASMSTSTTTSGVTYSSSSSSSSAALGGTARAAAAVGGSAGTIATIAVLPAGEPLGGSSASAQDAVTKLARALRTTLESTYGPTLLVDRHAVQLTFRSDANRLDVPFFRAKVTTWLSQNEEDCRFIILQGDCSDPAWSSICADQADCVLLVANLAGEVAPQVSVAEEEGVWRGVRRAGALTRSAVAVSASTPKTSTRAATNASFTSPSSSSVPASSSAASPSTPAAVASFWGSGAFPEGMVPPAALETSQSPAALLRRVELVLLHPHSGVAPAGTAAWLDARPLLTRHHHVRLARPGDVARLGRWMAGAAVGVVLSGGGSRGLAHLGVLRALCDAGVPIDVVGGTSQGAFMAGLFAQDAGWATMQAKVRKYAAEMGSVRRLIGDLTLPLLSVFSGAGFDSVVREAFQQPQQSGGSCGAQKGVKERRSATQAAAAAQRIEDLWLRFFCVTTDLTTGAPSVHQRGVLWRAVRASMTIVGLVPPVVDERGHLLCDGGYSDNLPVGIMRSLGVGTVLVVDVEDRDQSAWHNLTPTDGGVSGWQLLWDRLCPVPAWRFGIRVPGHAQLINALTWMAHLQNLARLAKEGHQIDLYLRPPVTQYRLLDYRLMDRIVKEAQRYAFVAVADWQRSHGRRIPREAAMLRFLTAAVREKGGGVGGMATAHRRCASVLCMSQLQAKQAGEFEVEEEEDSSDGAGSEKLLPPLELLQRAATALPDFQPPTHAMGSLFSQRKTKESAAKLPSLPPLPARLAEEAAEQPELPAKIFSPPQEAVVEEAAPAGGSAPEAAAEDDQFKYLEDIHIEFDPDDLPFA